MGRVKRNLATAGLSGKVGDRLVFRSVDNAVTIVAAPPVMTGKPVSEMQMMQRERFLDASIYASQTLSDEEVKAEYDAFAKSVGKRNGRALAIADFLNMPQVRSISLRGYFGNPGDVITATVLNDFRVYSVTVAIFTPQGTELERGNAAPMVDRFSWRYTVDSPTGMEPGTRIVVTVTDLPGNIASREEVL